MLIVFADPLTLNGLSSKVARVLGTVPQYDAEYNVNKSDMIKAIEDLYQAEVKRQENMNLEDAIANDNGPKEITVYCQQVPQVKIVDLAPGDRSNNECLVLHISAPDLTGKLVLKCDGSVNSGGFGEDW